MFPDITPVHRRVPTFHDDGAKRDAMAALRDAMAELIIVREAIRQCGEAADFFEQFAAREHRRAEGEVERLEAGGLQNLAPEIGVDGNGFPTHGGRGGIGQPVKTIDQAGFGIAQRRDDVGEKIRRHAHIGVADENQFVFRQPFKLDERGDFAVGAERFGADDELRVAAGIFFDEFADDFANRITGVGDAEQNLNLAGVILIEPALERFGGGGVAAFERFEQGDGRAQRTNR